MRLRTSLIVHSRQLKMSKKVKKMRKEILLNGLEKQPAHLLCVLTVGLTPRFLKLQIRFFTQSYQSRIPDKQYVVNKYNKISDQQTLLLL